MKSAFKDSDIFSLSCARIVSGFFKMLHVKPRLRITNLDELSHIFLKVATVLFSKVCKESQCVPRAENPKHAPGRLVSTSKQRGKLALYWFSQGHTADKGGGGCRPTQAPLPANRKPSPNEAEAT